MKSLSVVFPAFNEEANIRSVVEDAYRTIPKLASIFEIIVVNDGSTDKTKLQVLNYADERTMLIELRKNYGQSTAMTAGIDYSTGKYIALLDGDLQNDPSDIPAMLDLVKREDWDVVAGNRKNVLIGTSTS